MLIQATGEARVRRQEQNGPNRKDAVTIEAGVSTEGLNNWNLRSETKTEQEGE